MPHHDALMRPADDAARTDLSLLRSEIDRIDDALLDLMERRLSAAHRVAALKRRADTALLLLRPDREQDVLDRLSARAGHMPPAALGAIWRELMALSLQAQERTEIVLHARQAPVAVTNEARLRFGCAAPILVVGDPAEALERARHRQSVAVIELDPLSGWWAALHDDRRLAIFDALGDEGGAVTALAVGRVGAGRRAGAYPILTEAALRRRMEAGEAIRPLAMCGHLRLCAAEGAPR